MFKIILNLPNHYNNKIEFFFKILSDRRCCFLIDIIVPFLMKQIFLQKILIKISQPKNFKMYFPNMVKLSHL